MSSSLRSPQLPPFYTQVWRWHFYAGLLVAPIMVVLAITGLIYLYKPQLDALMYRELLFVASPAPAQPLTAQLTSVQRSWPTARVLQYQSPAEAGQSSSFLLADGEARWRAFVDPASARVLGSRDEVWNLQAVAKDIHGSLLIGQTGDLLIELACCWGLILLLSGLYLWWPRGRAWAGVLYPRLFAAKRLFWRDLHAVTAVWTSLLLLFMLLSGLPWTGFWGERFADIWSRYPTGLWSNTPSSSLPVRSLNGAGQQLPWAVEPTPLPHSGHHDHAAADSVPAGGQLDLDAIAAIARAQDMPAGYSISLPRSASGVYTLSVSPNDPRGERTLHIDQYSGQVLAAIGFADYALVPKLVTTGIALHEGRLFGWANQLLMTLACLAVLLVSLSGVIMWWQRRPRGRVGAPRSKAAPAMWKAGLLIVLSMGLLFPLVLASLLLIVLLDQLLQRLPALRRRLS